MPCVVKECGRRGATGSGFEGVLVAAWVTQSSFGRGRHLSFSSCAGLTRASIKTEGLSQADGLPVQARERRKESLLHYIGSNARIARCRVAAKPQGCWPPRCMV